MEWWPKARYNQIACLLIVGPMLLAPLFIYALDGATNSSFRNALIGVIVLLNITAASGVMFATWVCTYKASDDNSFEFKRSPKATLQRFQITLWLVPFVLVVVGFSQVGVISALAILLFIPSGLISPILKPRMIAMTHRRRICFECGYSLRGNPDATSCPECGEDVPWIDQSKTTEAAPTQDPTNHDRA